MKQGTQSQCTGTTLRDGMRREGGLGQGDRCTEIDVSLELSCFFHDPADVGNFISVSSAFPKTSLNIWKFTVHVFQKPGLENFEHYFASK